MRSIPFCLLSPIPASQDRDWDEGRITDLMSGQMETDGPACVMVSWRDGQAPTKVPRSQVWKMVADEDSMMATASLFQEVLADTPDMDKIARLLTQNADVMAANGEGNNMLNGAVDKGNAAVVKLLLDNGYADFLSALFVFFQHKKSGLIFITQGGSVLTDLDPEGLKIGFCALRTLGIKLQIVDIGAL